MPHSPWTEWKLAARWALPLLISACPAGLVFGALVSASRLGVSSGLLMSALIYSGSAQFVALRLLVTHAGTIVTVTAVAMLSLRFLLYSIALLDEIREVPPRHRMVMAFGLIDEVFVLVKRRSALPGSKAERNMFFLATVVLFYVNWMGWTAAGLVVGGQIAAHSQRYFLDFFGYATFVSMLSPYLAEKKHRITVGIAVLTYLLLWTLPFRLGVLLSCLIAVMASHFGMVFFNREEMRADES